MASPEYTSYPSLRDKIVVITGGAEGIGAAAATLFAHQGSLVQILDISESSATTLISQIRANATTHTRLPTFHHCDVSDLTKLESVARAIISTHGHVDTLINNAASSGGQARVSTDSATPEAWEANINTNLRHQFFLSKYLIPHFPPHAPTSSIVNMGSITWRISATGLPIYTLCKAAVVGLTRTHAREFGERYGVRVNSVMPGSIATERQIREVLTDEYREETLAAQAIKRVLKPEEVAKVVVFLASADASAVTGVDWCVDGGWVGDA